MDLAFYTEHSRVRNVGFLSKYRNKNTDNLLLNLISRRSAQICNKVENSHKKRAMNPLRIQTYHKKLCVSWVSTSVEQLINNCAHTAPSAVRRSDRPCSKRSAVRVADRKELGKELWVFQGSITGYLLGLHRS